MGSVVISFARSGAPDVQATERMLSAAPHRGSAFETCTCGGAALGVSNDPDFKDAWLASQGGVAAAFAGVLDNRRELDQELSRSGFPPLADDPAHVLLRAFLAWGDDAPRRLRGAFAGAFAHREGVRCFRDQIGFAAFFFRAESDRFCGASEPKQVLAGAELVREPDMQVIEGVFVGGADPHASAVKGVKRLLPASLLTVRDGHSISIRRYWDPSDLLETADLTSPELPERLIEVLEHSVGRAVTGSDVISLSGGIDSPTVAAVAAPRHLALSGRPLQALSMVYPDYPDVDEKTYIEAVAAELDLPLKTYVPKAKVLDDLGFWVDLLDGPWDTLPVPLAVEQYRGARALGGRTVLTGDLAEAVYTNNEHLVGHLLLHGRFRAAARWMMDLRARGTGPLAIARKTAPSLTPPLLASRYLSFRSRGREPPSIAPWLRQGDGYARPDLSRPARRRWAHLQLHTFGEPSVALEANDICAAQCGVHVRRPLLDVDLWEFFLSLPAEVKFPDLVPKSVVRQAMRGRLPDAILDRQDKTLFNSHALGTADYEGLRRWLLRPGHRFEFIDYDLLASRLERREMTVFELIWAYDLARIHAFLELFE